MWCVISLVGDSNECITSDTVALIEDCKCAIDSEIKECLMHQYCWNDRTCSLSIKYKLTTLKHDFEW